MLFRLLDHVREEAIYVIENVRQEFAGWTERGVAVALAAALFALYIAIPVMFIPGNTLWYYLSIEPWWAFVLLFVLSVEISLLVTPRLLNIELELSGNAVTDVATTVASFLPAVFACPILATAVLSFVLPASTIYGLVGSQWQIVGLFTVIAAGANYWKYSGCAKCQQWMDMEVNG